jgi:hypothetical protein
MNHVIDIHLGEFGKAHQELDSAALYRRLWEALNEAMH